MGTLSKAVGKGFGRPSFRVIQNHFAAANNVGAVAAKEEVWEVRPDAERHPLCKRTPPLRPAVRPHGTPHPAPGPPCPSLYVATGG